MKNFIFCFTILFTGILFSSCEKSDINYESDFEKSYNKWLTFKETSGNTYCYTVAGSSWSGPAWQTTITVDKGKVTQRSFKFTSTNGLGSIVQEDIEWTEDENSINSHEHYAADALTLDQVYDKARSEWLTKRENAKTYFETLNNGLISSCGYVENNCMDDCFRGIHIASIVAL